MRLHEIWSAPARAGREATAGDEPSLRRIVGQLPGGADSRAAPRAPRPGSVAQTNRRRTPRDVAVVVKGGVARALRTSGTGRGGRGDPGRSGGSAGRRRRARRDPRNPSSAAASAVAVEFAGGRARTAADGPDLEPRAQPVRRGHRPVGDGVAPVTSARASTRRSKRARRPPGTEDLHRAREAPVAPRHPRRHQRQLLTRRDSERLFGVGKVRAAALMKTRGRARRQREDRAADQAPAAAQEAPGAGRVPRRGGETRARRTCRAAERPPRRRAGARPANAPPGCSPATVGSPSAAASSPTRSP